MALIRMPYGRSSRAESHDLKGLVEPSPHWRSTRDGRCRLRTSLQTGTFARPRHQPVHDREWHILTVDSADNDRMMLRAAVLLASVSLVMALPAAGSEAAVAKSVTIRVLVMPVTRTIKDVPPKTFKVTGEWSKGDTFSGTSILRNAVSQFGKPKGARVGTSSFTDIALSSQMVRTDGVARLPGGTLHIRGVAPIGPTVKLPVVGGTGIYAGATGVVEGRHLANGDTLDVCRLQVP
jgi:hypothetical protein